MIHGPFKPLIEREAPQMSDFVTVANVADVPENEVRSLSVDGQDIVLINHQGDLYALEDRCSHEECPLSAGEVAGKEITCALHGARFDLSSGAPKALPAVLPVCTFECRVEGDEVQVKL